MQVEREHSDTLTFGLMWDVDRGGRVRNAWPTCPDHGDSRWKRRVKPDTFMRGDLHEENVIGVDQEGAAPD